MHADNRTIQTRALGLLSAGWLTLLTCAFDAPPTAAPALTMAHTATVGTHGSAGSEHGSPASRRRPFAWLEAPAGQYASVRTELRIGFDGPVDRGAIERRFRIEPEVAGKLNWLDERTLRFQPEGLAYNTAYQVELRGPDADDSRQWTFTTIKPITLTFDDCASTAGELRAVLAFLAERNIRAIMFVTGVCRDRYPWLVPAMLAAGHKVCNHTYSHPHLTRLTDVQIAAEIRRGVHAGCDLLRPPFGDWDGPDGRVARLAAQQGYRMFLWDVETYDWRGASAGEILQSIYNGGGGVILLHFFGRHTLEALRQLDIQPATPA
jgi:peptidoglycan/xylan/chitin deacetylase (PgdA/CDA1 family)